MRAAYLDDARQDLVSQATREVLARRGALVSDHSGSRVLFRGYKPGGRWTWDRGGYVGIYQHVGEREVEVRLLLRARWPYRLLWTAAILNVVAAIATIALNPPGTTWFSVAALGGFSLLVTGLLYVNTWRPVWREEQELMEALEAEYQRDLTGADLETEEEREVRLLEESLEGELARQRVAALKAAEPKPAKRALSLPRPRFNLSRKPQEAAPAAEDEPREVAAAPAAAPAATGAAPSRFAFPKLGRKRAADAPPAGAPPAEAESLEEKKARLLARKAELEARQREAEQGR